MKLFDYTLLIQLLQQQELTALASALPKMLESGLNVERYGDIPRWQAALDSLPNIAATSVNLNASAVAVAAKTALSGSQTDQLLAGLKGLHPWRKGPFDFFGTYIDTEWRSDLKWDRLISHIEPLAGKRVLDVGCGSGYHCWRMAGEGAKLVLGIDPTPLFVMQYWALQKYIQNLAVWVVPTKMEALPANLQAFDTVFSMGVLYHRRSPFDHLQALKDALLPGGELVLETLVIDGKQGEVLVPQNRYSKMGNVWFIPSASTLCGWLKKLKFTDIKVLDVSVTTAQEQRSTQWMQFHSLNDFLDPNDSSKTVEGYPAPLRAIVSAKVN